VLTHETRNLQREGENGDAIMAGMRALSHDRIETGILPRQCTAD